MLLGVYAQRSARPYFQLGLLFGGNDVIPFARQIM
jgi:hypothetical protein